VAASFLSPLLAAPDRPWTLVNARTGETLATSLETAFDSTTRNRGLLGRSALPAGSALVLAPCSAVHTFFMRFAIDIAFVDREGRILKVAHAMKPWRLSGTLRGFATIELPAGVVDATGSRVHDFLRVEVR
jgi:uncharacterized protein